MLYVLGIALQRARHLITTTKEERAEQSRWLLLQIEQQGAALEWVPLEVTPCPLWECISCALETDRHSGV